MNNIKYLLIGFLTAIVGINFLTVVADLIVTGGEFLKSKLNKLIVKNNAEIETIAQSLSCKDEESSVHAIGFKTDFTSEEDEEEYDD